MKQILFSVFLVGGVFLTTGCQSTPSNTPKVKKDVLSPSETIEAYARSLAEEDYIEKSSSFFTKRAGETWKEMCRLISNRQPEYIEINTTTTKEEATKASVTLNGIYRNNMGEEVPTDIHFLLEKEEGRWGIVGMKEGKMTLRFDSEEARKEVERMKKMAADRKIYKEKEEQEEARRTTLYNIEILIYKIQSFWMDCDTYPKTLKDLQERPNYVKETWNGPYMEEPIKDGWDRDFHYEVPGPGEHVYHVYSLGADNKPGGTGLNFDFSNITLQENQ